MKHPLHKAWNKAIEIQSRMPHMTKAAKSERATRRRNLARSVHLTWTALRSHLADAVIAKGKDGNELWQARCVREYSEIIYALSVELESLAKLDFPDKFESQESKI